MAGDKHDAPEELALEVAKLKVRVAAEKAEPGRLLKQGIRTAPLGSVGGAIGAGVILAILGRRRRARPAKMTDVPHRFATGGASRFATGDPNRPAGLGALAIAMALELAKRYFPDLVPAEMRRSRTDA